MPSPFEFRHITVQGTLTNAAGNKVSNASLSFTLTKPLGVVQGTVIVDKPVLTTTDNNGFFSVELWKNGDSAIPLEYLVTFPTEDNGSPNVNYTETFSIPSLLGGSSALLGDLISNDSIIIVEG